ncbi:unnamed protein product, partial [Penicillium salamii]
ELELSDTMKLIDSRKGSTKDPMLKVSKLSLRLAQLLAECQDLITQAHRASLSRIAITGIISFAKVSQLHGYFSRTHSTGSEAKEKGPRLEKPVDYLEVARSFLSIALKLCDEMGNCPELREQVQEMAHLYEGPRYEKVTLEEVQAIKTAMVGGRGGMATNSGHWYNCANGHPVSEISITKTDMLNLEAQIDRMFLH